MSQQTPDSISSDTSSSAERSGESASARYNPQDVEKRTYDWWEKSGFFKAADQSKKPPFSIILPPPNVTGQLHMGHALDHTIQDLLIRWKRMSGYNALWLPGTDHAGIATQSVVERELKKEGKTRREMGREAFLEKVWEWKHQYGNRIYEQMRRLGDSCDWDRATFTLDEGVSKAVRKVFVDLHKRGLIYRGQRLVNWSGPLETAISDLEVEHRETKGTLYHIAYSVEGDESQKLVVATTRPETLLGDSAVAVHPADERYAKLVGRRVKLPLTDRTIAIIADEYVDKEFGTGVVKITPAHDFNDYQVGVRHKLEMINILNKNGTLNERAGKFNGLKVQEARKQILIALKEGEYLVKEEPHTHSVGYCSRSGAAVEPFLSEQWFARMSQMATAARHVVENGSIQFEPESWTKVYLHWMSIIEDWCISRQLWWGHRIPAWTCGDCAHVTVSEVDPTGCEKCHSKNLSQDEDVLDTWFSSALWPFSTMGWPNETEAQKTFYPTNVLVTGHDIIFFWVARMIIMGLEFKKDIPFRKVYLHGLVRDGDGKKMSKSTGNALDPVQLIESYGADALRFTLLASIATGRDLKFSESRLEGYRNFMNKIWNATRFAMGALEDFEAPPEGVKAVPPKSELSVADQWIVWETAQLTKVVDEYLAQDRYSDAASALYQFVWNEFCDWYLEFVKPVIYSDASSSSGERKATQLVLVQTLNRIMRLLHPFTPFITEEIYQKLPIRGEACVIDQYPTLKNDKEWLSIGSADAAFEMNIVKEVITAIRNIRGENQIKPGVQINVRLAPSDDRMQKILGANKPAICRIARVDQCEIGEAGNLSKCAVAPVRVGEASVDVIVPLEGLVDIAEEVKRIQKAVEKIQKDIGILTQKLSNENFVKNAPEELVASDKALLEGHKARLARLQESLTRLS
ncbi:MAG: valine--tRNA ligase [Bdellovibrionales bacterium]|jgi:valyl-tRNA synthetase|nr:valine--tRNA ligase [Bdellovibrionales bacterium]